MKTPLVMASDRDPLDDVPRDLATPPIVDPSCPRVRMASQVLHVLQRYVLLQEIGHGRDAERVRREVPGEPRGLQPPLHHAADVDPGHRVLGERLRLEVRRAEEAALANLRSLDVLPQELL